MLRRFGLCFALLCAVLLQAAVYTPASVPDPKEKGQNYYVSNPDSILADSVVNWLNTCAVKLNAATKVEMAVVVLGSIGDTDLFDFSYELFQRWGIGGKGRNTGVLILFVLDIRKVRIMTGTGIEGILTDARCSKIIHEDMIPAFKAGEYGDGLCLGALRIYEICTDGEAPQELLTIQSVTNRGKYTDLEKRKKKEERTENITTYLAICLVMVFFIIPLLGIVLYQRKDQDALNEMGQRKGCLIKLIIACVFCPFLIPAALWFWKRSKRLRCPICGKQKYVLLKQEKEFSEDGCSEITKYHFYCSNCGYSNVEEATRRIGGALADGGGVYYDRDDYDDYDSSSSYDDDDDSGSWGGGSTSGGGAEGSW